jgi:hypothetical protein
VWYSSRTGTIQHSRNKGQNIQSSYRPCSYRRTQLLSKQDKKYIHHGIFNLQAITVYTYQNRIIPTTKNETKLTTPENNSASIYSSRTAEPRTFVHQQNGTGNKAWLWYKKSIVSLHKWQSLRYPLFHLLRQAKHMKEDSVSATAMYQEAPKLFQWHAAVDAKAAIRDIKDSTNRSKRQNNSNHNHFDKNCHRNPRQ